MLIAQLTDLHVRPPGVAAYHVSETNMLTERALRAVSALRPAPDVVIITGDLTDCGLTEEYRLLAQMVTRHLRVPVFFGAGNHDRREVLLAELPAVRSEHGFVQYAVEDYPVRLVMLDSVVPGAGHGELCADRLAWLDRTLAAAPDKPTLIGLHHPPFHCGIADMDRIALHDPGALRAVLTRHRQVGLLVCGHHHRPMATSFAGAVAMACPSVAHQCAFDMSPDVASVMVMEPPAFQLHRWTPEDGFVSHTVYVEAFPGPYPFILDPDYPGSTPTTLAVSPDSDAVATGSR